MKQLTRDQIEVLREMVQQDITDLEGIATDANASILTELHELRTTLEAVYHATPDTGTELLS